MGYFLTFSLLLAFISWGSITKDHRPTVDQTTEINFLSSGGQMSKIKVSTKLVSLRPLSLACRWPSPCVFTWILCVCVCVLTSSSDKDTSPIDLRPHPDNFICLRYLSEDPFSKTHAKVLGVRASTCESGGTQSSP